MRGRAIGYIVAGLLAGPGASTVPRTISAAYERRAMDRIVEARCATRPDKGRMLPQRQSDHGCTACVFLSLHRPYEEPVGVS